jgi:hypothetical protein
VTAESLRSHPPELGSVSRHLEEASWNGLRPKDLASTLKFLSTMHERLIFSPHLDEQDLIKFYADSTTFVGPRKRCNKPWKSLEVYFRGLNTNLMRGCLKTLALRPNTDVFETSLEADEYFKEFGAHKIALGLPGRGDLCFRDFEAFALKVPLLRSQFSVTLAEPLIPDHHYIKVRVRNKNNPEMLAEDIIKRAGCRISSMNIGHGFVCFFPNMKW